MEIMLPLLEEYKLEPEQPEPAKNPSIEKAGKKNAKAGKGKVSGKQDKGKKGKKSEDSPYAAADEHEHEVKSRFKNTSFKTERQPWTKIIQFSEEALKVNVPINIEKKLTLMRDTFRSKVNVKAIFTQVLPPQKPSKKDKKGKKDTKGKKENEKGKNKGKEEDKWGKGTKDQSKTVASESNPELEPTETIVKKITLANFNCELQVPNWANKTIDYYWCKHDKFPPQKGIQVEGSLRNIIYKEGKKKGKNKTDKDEKGKKGKEKKVKDKKGKASPTKVSTQDSKISLKSKGSKKGSKSKTLHVPEEEFVIMKVTPEEDLLPDVFTVQVGFGLNRTPPDHRILIEETNFMNTT